MHAVYHEGEYSMHGLGLGLGLGIGLWLGLGVGVGLGLGHAGEYNMHAAELKCECTSPDSSERHTWDTTPLF